jgi:hypothetical protein
VRKNMKKLIAMGIAVLVLALVAAPAMARVGCPGPSCGGDEGGDLTIVNSASITNVVNTQASTGYISLSGMKKPKTCGMGSFGSTGLIMTGDAGAYSDVLTQANYVGVGCDCVDGDITVANNGVVNNVVNTQASTGYIRAGGGWVVTGDAYAGSLVTNLVNTVMVGYAPAP